MEKSTKNILHPKLQGANPAIKASNIQLPSGFFSVFSGDIFALSARRDFIKK
jgi:hypothetical protein